MGFSTPSYDLNDLFKRIDRGDLQLPDFQRSYVWDVDHIRSLLVTVLRGYPLGSVMALDTRNEAPRFRSRPIEGAPHVEEAPGLLLLDGQQRLTTLYQCLQGSGLVESVDFRKKKIRRKYYVDVDKAVSADVMPDEAVIAVDEHGEVKSHFADPVPGGVKNDADALAAGLIPVSELLSDSGTDLLFDLADNVGPEARERVKAFNNKVLKPLAAYSVPMIRLDRSTVNSGIGIIFAHANSRGLKMDVYELLTAMFRLQDEDFNLSEHWERTREILRRHPALDGIGQTQFLAAVSLYVTAKKGRANAHREAIVHLSLDDYLHGSEVMRAAFDETATFLNQRCILSTQQVPYEAQLVPLAVIIALLTETPEVLEHQEAWDRLHRWFWCGVFGEIYGGASIHIRSAIDVDEVTAWVRAAVGGFPETEVPRTVRDARFVESRLLSAEPDSGVYKGIDALIMGRGARDWRTGITFDRASYAELGTHFRPVFPLAWCEEHGVPSVLADSVLNRTPMSRRTHVMVENSSPARYMYRIQSKSLMGDEEFDEVLRGHLMEPKLILAANAEEFFPDRRRRFVQMIEEAMGAAAIRDVDESNLHGGEEGPSAFLED